MSSASRRVLQNLFEDPTTHSVGMISPVMSSFAYVF
jgi:hypothetical protein